MLARAGRNGDHIATTSNCLYNLLLNIKNVSLMATLSKLQKTSSISLCKLSIQVSMVLSSGVLVNKVTLVN